GTEIHLLASRRRSQPVADMFHWLRASLDARCLMRNFKPRSLLAFGTWRSALAVLLLLHVAPGRDVLVAQSGASAGSPPDATGAVYRFHPNTHVPPSLES